MHLWSKSSLHLPPHHVNVCQGVTRFGDPSLKMAGCPWPLQSCMINGYHVHMAMAGLLQSFSEQVKCLTSGHFSWTIWRHMSSSWRDIQHSKNSNVADFPGTIGISGKGKVTFIRTKCLSLPFQTNPIWDRKKTGSVLGPPSIFFRDFVPHAHNCESQREEDFVSRNVFFFLNINGRQKGRVGF